MWFLMAFADSVFTDRYRPLAVKSQMESEQFAMGSSDLELTVIIVSYNTRELTLKAVETLLRNSPGVAMRVVVFDNASSDGSAKALAERFPGVEVIAHGENLGFAASNNRVAETVTTPWICLLNPDTETYPGAIANLLAFAQSHPGAGIVGGRTVFPDGSLNPVSCLGDVTPWSLAMGITGLSRIFPASPLFNPEGIGGWKRDKVREVDVVVGCFLMISRDLWRKLGGFDLRYFMYGEDVDLSIRARKLGYRPMMTPQATIMHLVGASTPKRADKLCTVLRAKSTVIREHWHPLLAPIGVGLLWLWGLTRRIGGQLSGDPEKRDRFRQVWASRRMWLAGFPPVTACGRNPDASVTVSRDGG